MYEIILILHLIGVVFGAGSALVSDALFFGAIRDHHIEKTELNIQNIILKILDSKIKNIEVK